MHTCGFILRFILLLIMCLCLFTHGYMNIYCIPEGGCKPPDMGTENQAQVVCENNPQLYTLRYLPF